MKKTLIVFGFVAFAAIALSSCKKDYTCECTSTVDGIASISYPYESVKKSDATESCDALNATWTANSVGKCELK